MYPIVRSRRRTVAIQITKEGTVIIRAPYRVPILDIEKFVAQKQSWIKKHISRIQNTPSPIITPEELASTKLSARATIQPLIEKWSQIMKLKYTKLRISGAKSRWGSCSTQGTISINWRLLLTTPELLEYVIIHELAHLKHPNHSSQFWSLVAVYCPHWKLKRKQLNTYSYLLK